MQIDVSDYENWIGKAQEIEDRLEVSPLNRMAATLNQHQREYSIGEKIPTLWHWLYFLESTPQSMLATDGHAKKGKFLPPINLPHRMWAGSRFSFKKSLKAGDKVIRISRIKNISVKQGKTGTLVFVNIAHEIKANSGLAIIEEHDIVYRDNSNPSTAQPPIKKSVIEPDFSEIFKPDPILLFRYSALTFNGHRIHYDRDYVTHVEGYPGLIVHGPLLATLLIDRFHRNNINLRIRSFEFKALHPVFDLNPFKICSTKVGDDNKAALWIEDYQHNLCMRASVLTEAHK